MTNLSGTKLQPSGRVCNAGSDTNNLRPCGCDVCSLLTAQQLRDKIENLEAQNDHAGVALLIAEEIGTEKDVFVIRRINRSHQKIGYLPEKLAECRHIITAPLFAKLRKLK